MERFEPKDLFRAEAIEGRRYRLSGDTLLRTPLMTLPVTLLAIGLVVAASVAMAVLPFSREYRAAGWLAPEAGVVDVRSSTAGIATAVYVAEGARVRAGDAIATISTDNRLEAGGSVQGALIGASRDTADLLNLRERTLNAAHQSTSSAGRAALASLEEDRARLQAVVSLKRREVAAKKAQAEEYEKLVQRGFGSGLERQRRQSDLTAAEQGVIEAEMRVSALAREIGDLRNKLVENEESHALAINELRQQRLGASSQLVEAAARKGSRITAPAAGVVGRLSVRVGQTVDPAAPLLTIVPPGPLEVALLAPAQSSGLPEAGSRARILVDAFPFRRYGALRGYVKSVSRSTTVPDDSSQSVGVKVPYFVVRVVLDPQQSGRISRADLKPGMTVEGRLELEKRSVLSWLLPQI
ncbi:MAG TPA: HlyD family efflux transporter periplasmic adaptor subunit [Allosphingosinicella sp.]|jgi:membrane fusion protein